MKKIIWKVTGKNLETLYIEANSFDSAIAIARNVSENYCSGEVVSENYCSGEVVRNENI